MVLLWRRTALYSWIRQGVPLRFRRGFFNGEVAGAGFARFQAAYKLFPEVYAGALYQLETDYAEKQVYRREDGEPGQIPYLPRRAGKVQGLKAPDPDRFEVSDQNNVEQVDRIAANAELPYD